MKGPDLAVRAKEKEDDPQRGQILAKLPHSGNLKSSSTALRVVKCAEFAEMGTIGFVKKNFQGAT